MTKPEEADKPQARKPIIRSPYVRLPSKKFLVPFGVLKGVAMLIGFVGTVLCFMGVVGYVSDDILAQLGGGLGAAILLPLLVGLVWRWRTDRPNRRGVMTDTLAIFWLGFTFLFAFAAGSLSGNLIHAEADRLLLAEAGPPAQIAYFLASPASSGILDASWDGRIPPHDPFASELDAAATALAAPEAPPADAGVPRGVPVRDAGLPTMDLFHRVQASLVTITTANEAGPGGGTGFFIDEAGTIATARHVVDGAVVVRVELADGRRFEPVDLLAADPATDLALLRVDLTAPIDAGTARPDAGLVAPRPLVLGDSDQVAVNEPLVAFGNPLALDPTLTDGVVSARPIRDGLAWIQLSVPVAPGNAGAPVLNAKGEVVGVTTGQIGTFLGQTQNLNLAIPANALRALVQPSYPNRRPFCGYTTCPKW